MLEEKNAINLDPFELAERNHNETFIGTFRIYCACCIVNATKQLIARRKLMKLHNLSNFRSTGVWKVKGYSNIITQGFVLWTGMNASNAHM